ncbi:MAG: ribosome maturation factor RimP [Oscillospiraceae bacterium]
MATNKGGNTVKTAFELAKPLADELGLILWDISFEKEGASWYLRVYIDKEDGIDLEDCEAFSRPFNTILDEKDFITQSYIFEVSSPGLERLLKQPEHFERYIGFSVIVHLIRADDGVKEIAGILNEYSKDFITVKTDDGEKKINFSDIAHVKLNDSEDLFD